MKIVLRVPLKPPSKNDLRPDPRVVFRGGRPVPSAFLRFLGVVRAWDKAIPEASELERARGRRRSLRFVRLMGGREKSMDEWNLSGGLNLVVVDLLVKKGFLANDDRASVVMLPPGEVRVEKGSRVLTPQTMVFIEDVEAKAFVEDERVMVRKV